MVENRTQNISLDPWNYSLYSIELVTNMLYLPLSAGLFYYIKETKTFHRNFRSILGLINFAYIVAAVYRSADIIAKFCQKTRNATFFKKNVYVAYYFYLRLSNLAWLVLIGDRIMSCYWANRYEETFRSKKSLFLFNCELLALSFGAAFGLERWKYDISESNSDRSGAVSAHVIVDLVLQVFFAGIDAMGIYVILQHSKKQHNTRHENMISLSKKFHITRNILASKYILFVTVAQLVITVVYMVCTAILDSNVVPGQSYRDESTHWVHAIETPLSLYRLFFAVWLLYKNEKFRKQWIKSQSPSIPATVTTISTAYMMYHMQQWK